MSSPYYRKPMTKSIHNEDWWDPIYKEDTRNWKIKKLNKIMKNKELIQKLIIDPYFNIYTRNGLEYILSQDSDKTDLDIYLVDFNNVKGMNLSMGYQAVNDLFKKVFEDLKPYFTIGRAFSGDEIFFCTHDFMNTTDIEMVCRKYNLELVIIKEIYHPYFDDITVVLENMIEKLHRQNLIISKG